MIVLNIEFVLRLQRFEMTFSALSDPLDPSIMLPTPTSAPAIAIATLTEPLVFSQ